MSKEDRQLNQIEIHLLTKMRSLPEFRKFADELLLELISCGKIEPRTEEEIGHICSVLYRGLERLDAEEDKETKQTLN